MKKLFQCFLLCSALAALLALAGCTACDNSSSSVPPSSSSSSSSSVSSHEDSIAPPSSSSSVPEESSSLADNSAAMVPTLSGDFAEFSTLGASSVTWGPGHQMDDANRPTACVGLQEQYGKYDTFFIGDEKGKIYLTFDEGYENGGTSKILDLLKEKKVQAVFFVTMHYVKSNPDLIQRMIDEGHIVGNHSDKHPANGYPSLPLDAVQADVMSLHNYVKENFDYDMSLFRYPAGLFSEQNLALINRIGYRQLFWSFAYSDWDVDKQPEPKASLEKVVGAAHDGAIYLLHAVSDTNVQILPQAIDEIRAKGFEFALFPLGEPLKP